MRTGKVLEELRDLRAEMRDLRLETRDLHAENRDMLRFTGEVVRRNELAFLDMSAALGELREESRAAAEASRAAAEETRAHTKAIFALIDRFQGGGAAPAT